MKNLKLLIFISLILVQKVQAADMDQLLYAQKMAHRTTLKATGNAPAKTTISISAKELLLPTKTLRYSLANGKPHTTEPCNIQRGPISQDEKDIINLRKDTIIKNFQSFIKSDMPIKMEHIPNIAVCTSGGGYRAMIATLGFFKALKESEILDLVLYASSLSGSAWALACWISAKEDLESFIANVKNNLIQNESLLAKTINKGMLPAITNAQDIKDLVANLATKYLFDQEICLTDIWGALIINDVLSHIPIHDKQNLRLTDQVSALKIGSYPFPLYAAIQPVHNVADGNYNYNWFEFSPTDVRNLEQDYNYYLPTWAFGRYFENGSSVAKKASDGLLSSSNIMLFPPEMPLSCFLGVCGSAFTINAKEIIRMLKNAGSLNPLQEKIINNILGKIKEEHPLNISGHRLFPGTFFNPEYKSSQPKNQNSIPLIDAGIDFNLPVPPLLNKERNIDIIIVMDASSNASKSFPELLKAQNYARQNGLHFPKIHLEKTKESGIIVFEQPNSPTVIYIPFENDCLDSYCTTFNFVYTGQQFDEAINFAYNATKKAQDFIGHAIAMKYMQKSGL